MIIFYGGNQKKTIKLTNLLVSVENPRFEMVTSQREAIYMMVVDQGEKLIRLAKDIIDSDLNPTDPIYVTPSGSTRYTVLEGNRRVTILKILNSPESLDLRSSAFLNKLKPYIESFKKKPILNIDCVVFSEAADADKWIELKHTGENGGIGTVSWDTTQQARFNKKVKGHNPIALQAIELLERSIHTDNKLKSDLSKLSYTNIERLLTDPDVRETLGIKYQNKILSSELEEEQVVKGLSKIASDFLYKNYTVNNIRAKKDRKKYLEEFDKNTIPDVTRKADSPWQLISSTLVTEAPQITQLVQPTKKSNPPSTDRKSLIPRSFVIKIDGKRENDIYHELKNLVVGDYVNAVSVIFRVFIELSIDAFIASKNGSIKGVKKMTPLREKFTKVADYFQSSGILSEEELKPLRVLTEDDHDILSIDTFNAYVHNRHFTPNENHLKRSWDNIQIFVEKLWENIK